MSLKKKLQLNTFMKKSLKSDKNIRKTNENQVFQQIK